MSKKPVYLNQVGLVCAAGSTPEKFYKRCLSASSDCMTVTDRFTPEHPLHLGVVKGDFPIDPSRQEYHTRNNGLLWSAMSQILDAFKEATASVPAERIGIILGTSTSGVAEAEAAIEAYEQEGSLSPGYHYRMQEMSSPAEFLADELGAKGPVFSISTACSSGAKALAAGRRYLRMGICDVVIAGGVDTLCNLTVKGFSSLEAVSKGATNPFSMNRDGINIGEGAAVFLMSNQPEGVKLSGVGETSDAHHFSAPEPEGRGARAAMMQAMQDGGLEGGDIGYINLHGTGTEQNDAMESRAIEALIGSEVPASTTKPLTGHTLGAAGAVEAAVCWMTLMNGRLPPQIWDGSADKSIGKIHLCSEHETLEAGKAVLSNSFAFGGNNIALIFEKA